MTGHFAEECKRRSPKFNEYKRKVMVLGKQKGSICKVFVEGTQMEYVSDIKYLGCM